MPPKDAEGNGPDFSRGTLEERRDAVTSGIADMTERIRQLLDSPGISDAERKRLERQLEAQERGKKKIERRLGRRVAPSRRQTE
jgi:hypothetical protein